jgi:DNA-directed RNA polymerase subunit RPC12/RpoP
MGAKRVDGRDNSHTAKSYGHPLGIECEACEHRALVPLDKLGILDGSMRPLRDWPFKCSRCGTREVALRLFARRVEADAWAAEA